MPTPHARPVRLKHPLLTGAATVAALLTAGVVATAGASAAASTTLYVSPTGKDKGACTVTAPCKTIQRAVSKAKRGDVVSVAAGTYGEEVKLSKDISVVGTGNPVVDALGKSNGFLISGPGSAGAVVRGFVVENATFEGILAVQTTGVTIENNVVHSNDAGARAAKPTGECAPAGNVPGDCGEALHLMSVTNSIVTDNTVTGNLGGILLTDELGPTARNTISHNNSSNNPFDCGITLAGHNPKATLNGTRQPRAGGVYNNQILDNVVDHNGTKGEGAGIIMAGGAPGAGVYGNLVKGNIANNNGLAGIEIHSHFFGPGAPPADLNGNRILDNFAKHDGVSDRSDAEFGRVFARGKTVGILVGSDVVKLRGIQIRGNTISHTHFGIFAKNDRSKVRAKKNKFHHVKVKVRQV